MKNFDYLIIGAGSAGCVLANRLSSSHNNYVAIFESGGTSDTWKVDMPSALLYTMHDSKMNWKYYSEPEPYLNNRKIFCPRGKMIGGCSSHNGMVFVRGHKEDYNRWASYGLNKWSYSHVLPYFKKLETWSGGENLYRGDKGPLKVNRSKINEKFPLFQAVLNAASEAGFQLFEDSNGSTQEGFGTFDVTIHKGKRYGAGRAYLDEVKNKQNLKIFTNSNVQKILFKDKAAIGIEVIINGKVEKYFANKEVLLSAGSINSPKILQLSGIGEAKELKKHNINIIHNLPGVGQNLQDHLEVYIQHKSKKKETLYDLSTNYFTQAIEGMKWFLFNKGKLSYSHLELGGFVLTDKKYIHPNVQYHFFPSLVYEHGLKNPEFDGFQFHASPNRPKSRGFVKLRSNNVNDHPFIQFNYLEAEEDLIQMRDSISIANKIFSQPSLSSYLGDQLRPGYNCKNNEELDQIIKDTSDTAYHPSCTNKMGIDDFSVVDSETKVHGIRNLRVIDSSIMPDIVSGNLNAATLMIAEKASDIILGKEESEIQV
ncbi:MAG: Oxygen-dependent choline dehydrogenase [Alphaproteobacteria bacterium MarineAlpha5_Bin8]|nr:MAG: Oxygen-dependent choline dehydrogenase [Alphaproteobacteria bacterium MarineAlpha5_Bin8]PPR53542.1 MAG: Oxygen-dependent choline dehydrogenase [Alphaproteobacteria bacterium MarineAlpha5_Bin6]|tara:strand:- start:7571 stop:9187 length:1617 start_codon:yes stop_codon:yes gene_type:complete